ncbi:asparagine synthase (glutamine-hydrolyzing) [Rhodospira trueperi]|uniref:asparagine synthase (glutamine-hydrolyzing) n=1 Tax=Rhodospira trueperi TaxID=69960 RepID=A0A1G7GNL6_9PROT|nr:asparagine synthase (glutamine-hydrolyzing) [Rhodospira trueperi]SDE89653.1 asparagine synthase (glutamine-hydrolysing) [Rhodospira trueperi]
MCGLAGILNFDGAPASETALKAMTDIIAHRGPDDSGSFIDGALGLGHRRLAIIDLSPSGHQPMVSACGRFVLAYNGELYNASPLRAALERKGHRFCGHSDTEVVLNALVEWGPDALKRFNAMFALALWDRREKTLILARDRYGIKPLYFTVTNGSLLFGSEIKSMLMHPGFSIALNYPSLLEYFTFQNIFTDNTLFKGVKLLPAGTWAQFKADGSVIDERHTFWDFQFFETDTLRTEEDYLEELDELFHQAVNRQLVSDVEVGSYLSGGMDSGSITALATRSNPNLKTFTCGFDMTSASGIELSFDERQNAERMSYLFGTEQYEVILKGGDMARIMPSLIWHLEDPRIGQSYPNAFAARLASKFVKVVLSGAGGDEIFAGYPWRYYRASTATDFDDYIDKYYVFWQRLIPNRLVKSLFAPVANEVEGVWTRNIFRDVFLSHANDLNTPEDFINHSLYFEAKTFLHGLLLMEDKLSMAHSLETRVPFLDNDLVDFGMRVPTRFKLANLQDVLKMNENEVGDKGSMYFQRTRDGKLILRKMMSRHIPNEITDRAKQGFSGPDGSWFKGDSIDYVRDTLCRPDAEIYNVMDYSVVKDLIEEHLSGKTNRRLLIWSLLSFETWCRMFLKGGYEAYA